MALLRGHGPPLRFRGRKRIVHSPLTSRDMVLVAGFILLAALILLLGMYVGLWIMQQEEREWEHQDVNRKDQMQMTLALGLSSAWRFEAAGRGLFEIGLYDPDQPGRISNALTKLKIAVWAAMASPSVRMTAPANPGCRQSCLRLSRRFLKNESIKILNHEVRRQFRAFF
jgi:hypothetical protein